MPTGQESLAHRLIQPYLRSNTLCKLLIVHGCRSVLYVFLFVAIGFIFLWMQLTFVFDELNFERSGFVVWESCMSVVDLEDTRSQLFFSAVQYDRRQ